MRVRVRLICAFVLILGITGVYSPGLMSGDDADSARSHSATSEPKTNADLPSVGVSLFDRIFSRQTPNGFVYDVPFPFDKTQMNYWIASHAFAMAGVLLVNSQRGAVPT